MFSRALAIARNPQEDLLILDAIFYSFFMSTSFTASYVPLLKAIYIEF